MLTAVISVLLTFLFTGIAANRLIQAWQHRNWISQQRLADVSKRYETAQSIFDEMSSLAAKRQHRMLRLLAAVRSMDKERIEERRLQYDEVLTDWNDKLIPLFAKLAVHLQTRFWWRLENEIQPAFVSAGSILERLVRQRLSDGKIAASELRIVQEALNRLQRSLYVLNRDIIKYTVDQQKELYKSPELSPYNLDGFPTWELFKALFKSRVLR